MREKTAGNTSALAEVRRNLLKSILIKVKMFAIFSCVLIGKLVY